MFLGSGLRFLAFPFVATAVAGGPVTGNGKVPIDPDV